jgi:hypothetical protein
MAELEVIRRRTSIKEGTAYRCEEITRGRAVEPVNTALFYTTRREMTRAYRRPGDQSNNECPRDEGVM